MRSTILGIISRVALFGQVGASIALLSYLPTVDGVWRRFAIATVVAFVNRGLLEDKR